jgi:hypothetical protein
MPFRPGEIGTSRLLVRKDRHAATLLGGTPQDDGRVHIGDVILDGTGELSWTSETAITVTIDPPGSAAAKPPSVVTRFRELVKASDDRDPITSYEQARRELRCRKAEIADAFDFLKATRQVDKIHGRFVWLSDVPVTHSGDDNEDD